MIRGFIIDGNEILSTFNSLCTDITSREIVLASLSERLSIMVNDIYSRSSESFREAMPTLMSILIFVDASPVTLKKSCIQFIEGLRHLTNLIAASSAKDSKIYSLYLSLWFFILQRVISSGITFPFECLNEIENRSFPNLLAITVVTQAACSLTLSFPNGMDLLFDCIGYFQDIALSPSADTAAAINYIELIEIVVAENRRLIHNQCSEIYIQILKNRSINYSCIITNPVINDPNVSLSKTITNSETDMDIKLKNAIFFDEKRNKEEIEEFLQPDNLSYMATAMAQDEVNKIERVKLEASVSSDVSFLPCFLPY